MKKKGKMPANKAGRYPSLISGAPESQPAPVRRFMLISRMVPPKAECPLERSQQLPHFIIAVAQTSTETMRSAPKMTQVFRKATSLKVQLPVQVMEQSQLSRGELEIRVRPSSIYL